MRNPFRRFTEKSQPQEPLSEPVSISYGKAVQLNAEGAAHREKLNQPEKKHYDQADKEIAAIDESVIETMALTQKLKELVGQKQVLGFIHIIEQTTDKAKEFVKETAEKELEARLIAVLESIQRDNRTLNSEIVTEGVRDSVRLYELEAATKVEEFFDALRSKISYHQDLPNKEAVQEAVNELMQNFAKLAVQDAVNTYRNNLRRFIVKKLGEIGYKVAPEDLANF